MLIDKTDTPMPAITDIREGITLAPSWQQKQIMGQLVVTCIPLPICMEHLAPAELSATEKALAAGLVVPT